MRAKGHLIVLTAKKVRKEAEEIFFCALNQVQDAIHFNPKSKQTTKTIYLGNLDYNSDNIHLCEITIQEKNGKSRGYACVTLPWAKAANVNPSDICKFYSGKIGVDLRYIYLCKLLNNNLQTGYLGLRDQSQL